MKKINLIIFIVLIIFSLIFTACFYPTNSKTDGYMQGNGYSYASDSDMYYAAETISSYTLGLDNELSDIRDFAVSDNCNVYILLSDSSQIVVLNSNYTLNRIFNITDKTGNIVNIGEAQGIFVDTDETIYICDTMNSQILITDKDGKMKDAWGAPESDLLPEDFYYLPWEIIRTENGYTYVLSLSCYYGIMLYSPQNEFLGFYGANTVKASPLDTVSYLWEMLTKTDAKISFSEKELPSAAVDFCFDRDGYMVTCTNTSKNNTEQVRKLSPNGENMYDYSTNGSLKFGSEVDLYKEIGLPYPQNIGSIDIDEDNFIYALDTKRGIIYVYDEECNLIGSFGTGFKRRKEFINPTTIGVNGTDILVADANKMTITVFKATKYGECLMQAQSAYLDGDFKTSVPLWKAIRKYNDSFLAYRGLAMANFSEGRYEYALKYAEYCCDYDVYDMSWRYIKKEFISNNFDWIFPTVLLLLISLVSLGIVVKRKKLVLIKNEYLKTALSVTLHPFDAFERIKYNNMGSVTIGMGVLIFYYIANVLRPIASGFLDTEAVTATYNPIYIAMRTIGLVLIWSVANRLVASLFDGNGSFKEIFIATAYSLIPLTVFTFIRILLSNFLSISNLSILDLLEKYVIILTVFIFSVAIMSVHEYNFFKLLKTTVVTVFLILLITFVVLLIALLWQHLLLSVSSLYYEIKFSLG